MYVETVFKPNCLRLVQARLDIYCNTGGSRRPIFLAESVFRYVCHSYWTCCRSCCNMETPTTATPVELQLPCSISSPN
jgi:hypothetical protein